MKRSDGESGDELADEASGWRLVLRSVRFLGIFVLIHILSIGPVNALVFERWGVPPWLGAFYDPLSWAMGNIPGFSNAMCWYLEWWVHITAARPTH